MRRVEFRLSMPSRGSWNGAWSGEGRDYVVVRTLRDEVAERVMAEGPTWFHRWDDGWCAQITARVMAPGERTRRSAGFLGYEWMVENILTYGSPYTTGTTR